MITIKKQLSLPDTYPFERIGRREEILFFDIETTGFSADYSHLYLIGCIFYHQDCWHLLQWFAETAESEEELLHAFFSFIKKFQILIHFNGDRFDIPFLIKRCSHLGLSYDFSDIISIDIYRRIKPYKTLIGLDSLKQKAIEKFLGISRADLYSGGELISVYEEYLRSQNPRLYDLLLLHNEDDLKGMPSILPILYYPDFLEHPFSLVSQTMRQETAETGKTRHLLDLLCKSDYQIPISFSAEKLPFRCHGKGNLLQLSIELYKGTLKHFYPDYQNYYYLIYEDTAIHKSIGEYVDKNARIKAKAKTCYTKKEGVFIPQLSPIWEPVMKKDRRDKLSYASLSDVCFQDARCFPLYITQLLQYLAI